MKLTLNELYFAKIEEANEREISQFVFTYHGDHYLVMYKYPKWSAPVKIELL